MTNSGQCALQAGFSTLKKKLSGPCLHCSSACCQQDNPGLTIHSTDLRVSEH